MKITRKQLRQIIKEELNLMNENEAGLPPMNWRSLDGHPVWDDSMRQVADKLQAMGMPAGRRKYMDRYNRAGREDMAYLEENFQEEHKTFLETRHEVGDISIGTVDGVPIGKWEVFGQVTWIK